MDQPSFDPGLTQQYSARLRRTINKDGEFNVRRRGFTRRDLHAYLFLIHVRWHSFLGFMFGGFIGVNSIFAVIYAGIGIQHLHGAQAPTSWERLLNCFFFSAHTLTTVGYGSIWPEGVLANSIAAFEAMLGLMGFAVATGLLVARISRVSARLGFSESAIIAPYGGGSSLQFRLVNRGLSNLMELQARVLLMTVEEADGRLQRKYTGLKLERETVLFLPLTWTVVHPIDRDSPLYGKTAADLERLQAEFLILIRAVNDTFSQSVYARYSYRYDEIVWGARFEPAFEVDDNGDLRLELDKVGAVARAPLEPA
ncbi:MAG TPA: ion channel [Bryobacteraceae bacterium]|nr:ion channel [Bryobacteraceae bacterium]